MGKALRIALTPALCALAGSSALHLILGVSPGALERPGMFAVALVAGFPLVLLAIALASRFVSEVETILDNCRL